MSEPSTSWRETVAAGEAERHERQARAFAAIQTRESAKYGTGRALHRRQRVALRASFEVLPGLPEPARHGLFAAPARYETLVRLSSAGPGRRPDTVPDVRGFAVKVLGISGASALGGQTESQDFALINHECFSSATSEEFTAVLTAGANGLRGVALAVLRRPSLLASLGRIRASLTGPFTGFATEDFFSAAPIACGPYAVRVRLSAAQQAAGTTDDLAADVYRRLPLVHEVSVQFYLDDARTPIEDAAADWDSPYVPVARLEIPAQEPDPGLDSEVEAGHFDPWNALAEHRPLGEVMRARKVAYRASQLNRA
jgi:hypothetical protein